MQAEISPSYNDAAHLSGQVTSHVRAGNYVLAMRLAIALTNAHIKDGDSQAVANARVKNTYLNAMCTPA